jgi:hypothetical protein
MNHEVNEFSNSFWDTVTDCQRFCYAARAREFQVESVEKLKRMEAAVNELKEHAIADSDEDSANCGLAMECVARMLRHELQMWIALKDDNPNQAWDELVEAQSYAADAVRAHRIAKRISRYISKFELLEQLLFPPMTFFSLGLVISESRCSICGSQYGECDHIKGMPYMGRICGVELTKFELKEVSFVASPANKLTRIVQLTDGGVTRDLLSWKATSSE